MNKKTKLLSIFILAGVISTGVAVGATGCKKHSHNWSDEYTVQENGKHAKTCDGCSELLDEHAGEWTNDADTTCDHDGCDVTRTVTPPAADYVVDAAVTALKITGVEAATIQLNNTDKKSHTIDKSAIKVYFMKGSTQGDEVPAANLSLTLLDGSNKPVTTWENITTGGTYKINAKLTGAKMATGATVDIDDVIDTVSITIVNNVTGLELKTGATLKQKKGQPATTMTSTWNFQKVYQNGDKVDLTASDVEIGTIDTSNVGTGKTVTVTLKGTTITTTVTYEIEENDQIHVVSNAYVFGDSDVGSATDKEFKQGETTVFKVISKSGSVSASEAEYTDGTVHKKFYYRYTFGGGSFAEGSYAANSNDRYWDVTTEGAATITVYFASGGSLSAAGATFWGDTERGIAVFGGEWGSYDSMTLIGKKFAPNDNQVYALTVDVSAAGTYHIATANNGDMRLYGVQVDTTIEEPGADVTLPTATVPKEFKLKVNDTEEDGTTKKTLKVGRPFNDFIEWIESGTVVNWNPVTGDVTETAGTQDQLESATFKIKGVDILPNDTITTDMLGTNVEITITIGGLSTTHKVTVETAIAGITGITAGLKDDAKAGLEVDTDEDTFTLTPDMVEVKTKETVDGATIDASSIEIWYNDGEQDVQITDSHEFAPGTYTITVKARVQKGTDKTDLLETTFEFEVTVKLAEGQLGPVTITFDSEYSPVLSKTDNTVTSVTADTTGGSFGMSGTDAVYKTGGTSVSNSKFNRRYITVNLKEAGTYTITVNAAAAGDDTGGRHVAIAPDTDTDVTVGTNAYTAKDAYGDTVFENVVITGTKILIGADASVNIKSITITPVAGSTGGGTTNPGENTYQTTTVITNSDNMKTASGGDVTWTGDSSDKSATDAGDYVIYNSGAATIVSLDGSKVWKKNSNYLQADGGDRTLKIDLSSYAGTNVTIKLTVCSSRTSTSNSGNPETVTLYMKSKDSDVRTLPLGDAQGASTHVEEWTNVAGGSTVEFTNAGQGCRYYKVEVIPESAN